MSAITIIVIFIVITIIISAIVVFIVIMMKRQTLPVCSYAKPWLYLCQTFILFIVIFIVVIISKGQELCVWMGPDLVASATGGKGP